MMKKCFNYIKENIYFVVWMIVLLFLILININSFIPNIIRLYNSVINFFLNIWIYIKAVFAGIFDSSPISSLNLIDGNVELIEIIFPYDFKYLGIQLGSIFKLLFTKFYFSYYWSYASNWLLLILRFAMILGMCGLLLYFLFKSYFDPTEFDVNRINKESKNKKRFLAFNRKTIVPVYNFLKKFIIWSREHQRYFWISLLMILFKFKIISLFIECIGFIFAFVVTFNFQELWNQVVAILIDLLPILLSIPWYGYLIIVLAILAIIQIRYAEDEVRHLYSLAKIIVKHDMTTTNYFVGSPGVGKDVVGTFCTCIAESNLRYDLLQVLLDIRSEYPDFCFTLFELDLKEQIEKRNIINWIQAEAYALNVSINVLENDLLLYEYDYKNKKSHHYNELTNQSIFEALADYAHAYFMYIQDTVLAASNYAIRFDNIKLDSGHFVMYDDDFLSHDNRYIEDFSSYAHIYNFDWQRLYKKVKPGEDDSLDDGFISTFTEYDKERLNQITSRGLKADAEEANQLNDGTNQFLKTKSHINVIRNKRYGQSFFNSQREESLNTDTVQTFEFTWDIKKSSDVKLTLHGFWYSRMLLDIIGSWSRNLMKKAAYVRSDDILIVYIVKKINSFCYWLQQKINNRYGYHYLQMTNQYNKTIKMPIIYKHIYSDRYNTGALSALYKEKYLSNTKGFFESETYESSLATYAELKKTNSYFYPKFFNVINSNKDKKEVDTSEEDDILL